MKKWNELSMAERVPYIKMALDSGITDLRLVLDRYNSFAEGGDSNPYSVGSLVNAIYQNAEREEFLGKPSHNYDFTISEEEANRLGYYPDTRGHRDDRVKKPAHPSHPSRGSWEGDRFILSDLGMNDSNYILFGLNDGGQDPQAVLYYDGSVVLPEITVSPKGNYIHNSYDNINIYGDGGWLSKIAGVIPDTWKPWYWNAPKYEAKSLKEAIVKAYDDGNRGKDIIYNGKAYKALLDAEEEAAYNRHQQHKLNRNITNEEVVDSYTNNKVVYTMENSEGKGYNKGRWKVYTDEDSEGKTHYNYGPGIESHSDPGSELDYSSSTGYTTEQLNKALKPSLMKNMDGIMNDLHSMYGGDADTMSLGNRMILLDIAHNVSPRGRKNNMPKNWKKLTDAMMSGDPNEAKKQTYSGSKRRSQMRNDLLYKNKVDSNTVKNR